MRYRTDLPPLNLAVAMAVCLALAACGGSPRVADLPRTPKGPVSDWPVKIGNPYQVLGQWYYPKDDRNYDETGVASWYGPNFHGLNTANGETYDMEMISAAHKTLPLPSYAEVTNLDNGRRLVVRVNDRGPFVSTRIIDLSRKSAELLGMQRAGTARVRVRRVYPSEEVRLALREGEKRAARVQTAAVAPAPALPVVVAAAPPARLSSVMTSPAPDQIKTVSLPASATSATASQAPVAPTNPISFATPRPSFIQVAAVSDPGRASWLAGFLKAYGTPVVETLVSGLIRVRIGPYASMDEAQAALAKVRDAGYQEARIVSDGPAG